MEEDSLAKEEVGVSLFIPVAFHNDWTLNANLLLLYHLTLQSSCIPILIPPHNGQVGNMDNTHRRITPVGTLGEKNVGMNLDCVSF